ncbi:uncharacterized protein LOC111870108 isoform X3 [Cryptotermes secundus]|uniref:uncharacterized protein LOC111870108 isoform X3 n=1 Tax=Cryptotermes secundus TaxID=105785 RepID=UPI000CD7CF75|nr:uncharacterized protein LOC111870108 isoform X3 [Cryptotermes secundus]
MVNMVITPLKHSRLRSCHCGMENVINARDGLLSQVCQLCVLQVHVCYNFKLQYEMSDLALKQYLYTQQSKDTAEFLRSKCVKPKEEGSVEDTRMIGNKFCDVTVIAPHYVGNHASEQALAEKDLLSMHQDWFTMTENRCTKRSIMQLI